MTPSFRILCLFLAPLVFSSPGVATTAEAEDFSSAIVRIDVTSSTPNLLAPWQRDSPDTSRGSGVIIENQRILTAAHVVAGATMIEISRADSEYQFSARVEHICHDCDLALLSVSDPAFFEGSRSLSIGELPLPQQGVEVHGFPMGGHGLSVTSGIVSRVLLDLYVHSWRELLLVQVDAPINSGNSGGPALHDGRIAGIASQSYDGAENLGYIVPGPVIRHFLQDIEDGGFDGIPTLGLSTQPLQNPALRHSLGLDGIGGGILVTAVSPHGSASAVLEPGDVLLSVGGRKIGEDGRVALAPGVRVQSEYLEQRHQVGERIEIEFSRNGERFREDVKLLPPKRVISTGSDEGQAPYRIFAGLVFQPLTFRYLEIWGDNEPPAYLAVLKDPTRLGQRSLLGNTPDRPVIDEIVVLSGVLHNELSRGYQEFEDELVHSVDGVQVRSLAHLSQLLDTAKGDFVNIKLANGGVIVVSRTEAELQTPSVLTRYGVARDRSQQPTAVPASAY